MYHHAKPLPAAGELWARYSFNPLTGHLYSRQTGKRINGRKTRRHLRLDLLTLGGPFYVHRLIWKWCHGADPVYTIDHINQDPTDNRIWNLRDVTHRVQLRNHGKCKLNAEQVRAIKVRLASGEKQQGIALEYGVNRATIGDIKTGKCWADV